MAFGTGTLNDVASSVSDLFAASGDELKAQGLQLKSQGDLLEAQNYTEAANLAGQNAQFTAESTEIKSAQQQRETTMQIGQTQADIAGAGFANSGSSLDILADSARQGALAKSVLGQQGLITQAGYLEQQQSYQNMSKAADLASQEDLLASKAASEAATGADITAGIKGAAAIATLFV